MAGRGRRPRAPRDQIVAHVQTDKAEVELPVPVRGTVAALGADVGDLVPVGATLLELAPDAGTALGGTPVRNRRQRNRGPTAWVGRRQSRAPRPTWPVRAGGAAGP